MNPVRVSDREQEGSPTVPGRRMLSKERSDEACHDDGVLGGLCRGQLRSSPGGPSWSWGPRPWRLRAWPRFRLRASSSLPSPVHRGVLRLCSASGVRRVSGIRRCGSAGGLCPRARTGRRSGSGAGLPGPTLPAKQLLGVRPRFWIQLLKLNGVSRSRLLADRVTETSGLTLAGQSRSTDATGCRLDFEAGTSGTSSVSAAMIRSGVIRSASAWKLVITRWRKTGRATARTCSGVT